MRYSSAKTNPIAGFTEGYQQLIKSDKMECPKEKRVHSATLHFC